MRVLVVPEFYRPDDLTANGTVSDAITWMRDWLDRDSTLHVYVLGLTGDMIGGDQGDLLADHPRATLIEAEPPLIDLDRREPFTETGYSAAQLRALRREIYDPGGYVDVVVDQLRSGRETLYKWLLESVDQWAATVRPFDVVANVHDLQLPHKYRFCSYRNDFQFRLEAASAAFADGIWFTSAVDAAGYRDTVDFLDDALLEQVSQEAIVAGSPVAFEQFQERYADEPRWLHLAGSFWAKKNVDQLFDLAETLYEAYGIQTLLTSMEPIPEQYRRADWVDAHGTASRATYEWALEKGDIAVHASDYETMARTPFEQAASGQVLVLRDAPWAVECAPEHHPLLAPLDELTDRVRTAIEQWPEAVVANQRLVTYAKDLRGIDACGRRTYRDLRRRVDRKVSQYDHGKRPDIVARAVTDLGGRFSLREAIERSAAHTADGRPLTDDDSYAFIDFVYTLRALGYEDAGNAGTPEFRLR